jgi:hypothetical protein
MDAKWRLKSVSCERVNLKQRSATYHERDRTLERQPLGSLGDGVSCERVHLKQWSASRCQHSVATQSGPCVPSLRRGSSAAWLLGSRVRVPLRAWMFVSCVYMLYCPV